MQALRGLPSHRPPPVLCYHRVGGPAELGVTRVAPAVFARQMRALAEAGWRALTLREYADALAHPATATGAAGRFLLTFDDGYASLADYAFPLLGDLGFTATTFLVTDYVGRTNDWDARYTWRRLRHLDWPTVERWSARGFEFASHTATHTRLTWLNDARVAAELGRAREVMLQRLGPGAALGVAYPFGAVDDRVAALARSAGHVLGFGGVWGDHGSHLNLPRVPVYRWDRGAMPLVLRRDFWGGLGRRVAHVTNRCAVGTTLIRTLVRETGERGEGRGS